MPELRSADGRYLAADQEDGNFVVYRAETMMPVWDRWSAEAVDPPPFNPPHAPVVHTPAPTPPAVTSGERRVIRVTDARDGAFIPRMYAYWANACVLGDEIHVFVGHVSGRPRFFCVDIPSGRVDRLGSLLPYAGTSEGWSWNAEGWIHLCDGPRLRRVNPFTGGDNIICDITDSRPGCDLWQSHSSDDGRTHSATVRQVTADGPYLKLGTLLIHDGHLTYYPAVGTLDESALVGNEFLVVKEDDDNCIIPLRSSAAAWYIRDRERAVGHSDGWNGLLVGEADKPDPGACVVWDLRARTMRVLFETWNMGHVSVRGGRCLLSDETHISLVGLNGEGVTPLVAHHMDGSTYDRQMQANLDPTGRWACFLDYVDDRFDVFLMEIP